MPGRRPRCQYTNLQSILLPQAAQLRTLLIGENDSKVVREYRPLFLPPALFNIICDKTNEGGYHLAGLNFCFTREPLATPDLDTQIYGLPILNTDGGYNTCLYEWPTDKNKEAFIKKVINLYWSSIFVDYRDDFSYWVGNYTHEFLKNWIQATKQQNYGWIFEQTWRQTSFQVDIRRLLASVRKDSEFEFIFPKEKEDDETLAKADQQPV